MKNDTPVPVLMYHTIGIPDPGWQWRYLTCHYSQFEAQMKGLKKNGFVSVSLQDLFDYVFGDGDLPRKSFILTFDDGYVDNWIFAFPIMKKYGFKGTVFLSPDFADRRDIVRRRLDQVDSASELKPKEIRGFLSWKEMAEAEREGILDIQPHAMTHTWYPTGEKIVDFRHPGDPYIWMTWNENLESKPDLQVDDESLVRQGEPVYEHDKSLSSKRYFPNEDLANALTEHVKKNGGVDFFSRPGWREELFERAQVLRKDLPPGSYESEEEYEERIRCELADSKNIIEKKLGKKADFLCWPGGSGSAKGIRIANEIGYLMSTAANDMSISVRQRLSNRPSEKSRRIVRVPAGIYWDGKSTADSRLVQDTGFTLALNLLSYKKIGGAHIWGRLFRKMLKEYYRITIR